MLFHTNDSFLRSGQCSVRARSKKLISGDCYTIFHLISSDLKID